MAFITIITPTYNRAKEIQRLYNSLVTQTDRDFEWLVVDDGSSDGTENLINNYIKEGKVSITYVKKENGGKHTALNCGIRTIESPWTFIVDSDDYLKDDAVKTIKCKAALDDDEKICGLAFLRESNKGGFLTNKLVKEDGMIDDFCHCRYGLGIKGDMAEVWKTKYLKEFPFPEFANEKFCSEDVVWIAMAEKYKMVFYNQAIYMSDYLEGGLTMSRKKQNLNSPRGVMYRGIVQLKANLPLRYKCRAMLYYQVYGTVAGYTLMRLFNDTKEKILFVLMWPVTLLIYRKLT